MNYQDLRKITPDMADYIANWMYQEGLLSATAGANVHIHITEAINDFISDCQTEEAESKNNQHYSD